jgi:hypothetical protein
MTAVVSQISSAPLTQEEIQFQVEELMRNNSNCTAPCFWGIVPGRTDLLKSANIIFPLGTLELPIFDKNGYAFYNAYINYADKIKIDITVGEFQSIIENLKVNMSNISGKPLSNFDYEAFSLNNILESYGTPSSIEFWLSTPTEFTTSDSIAYNYRLYYVTKELVIEYSGQQPTSKFTDSLKVCPLKDKSIDKVVFNLGINANNFPSSGIHPDNAISLATQEFTSLMVDDPEKACFSINSDAFSSK